MVWLVWGTGENFSDDSTEFFTKLVFAKDPKRLIFFFSFLEEEFLYVVPSRDRLGDFSDWPLWGVQILGPSAQPTFVALALMDLKIHGAGQLLASEVSLVQMFKAALSYLYSFSTFPHYSLGP